MVLLGDICSRFLQTVRSKFAIVSSKLAESVLNHYQAAGNI